MSRRIQLRTNGGTEAVIAVLTLIGVSACATTQAFRLNPGEQPERFRVVCRDKMRSCEKEAEKLCDGEYTTLERGSTRPEQEEVDTTGVSSTGPSTGIVGWRGEILVQCGRLLPELRLQREEEPTPVPADTQRVVPPASAAPPIERVCVPGVTQACLGPGACSGAQACTAEGTGFGPCDCGETPRPAPSARPEAPASSTTPPTSSPTAPPAVDAP